MDFSKKSRIAFVNAAPPKRKRQNAEGDVIVEKLPGIRMTRKMLAPSGFIANISFACGKSVGTFDQNARPEVTDPDNSAALGRLKRMLVDGYLFYGECPYANGSLHGKAPCKGHDGSGRYWTWANRKRHMVREEECCEHITAIAKRRQEAHAVKQAEIAEQHKSAVEKFYEVQFAMMKEQEAKNQKRLNKARAAREATEE